jgi:iron complex outermembrane receptor protein
MSKTTITLAALAAISLFTSMNAGADDTAPDKIIVTATRIGDAAAQLPANITVIDADAIRQSPARTLPELLTLEAGVITRSLYGNNASQATVDLRGFGAAATPNTLILLNGRRLNDFDLGAVDFAAISLKDVERIEVIRGTGGVLYGDGAVGGAVNIVTREPARTGTHGQVGVTAGSHAARGLDLSVSHSQGPVAVNLYVDGLHSDGYRANNHLETRNAQLDVSWFHDRGEVFLRGGLDTLREGLPGVRTVDPTIGLDQLADSRRATDTPNDYARQNGRFLTLGATQYLTEHTKLVMDLGYRSKRQQAFYDDYAFGGAFANYLDTHLGTWSVTPWLEITNTLAGRSVDTRAGVDVYLYDYDSGRSLNPATAADPAHRLAVDQTSVAGYLQSTVNVTQATDVTLGVRVQDVDLKARDTFDAAAPGAAGGNQAAPLDSSKREHMLELGLRHRLSETLSVFTRIDRSVRFATVDEYFQYDPSTFLLGFTPLKPQVSRGVDLGVDLHRHRFRFQSSLYYMKLTDEIHYDPATFANINLDPTRRYGLESTLTAPLTAKLRLTGNYTYTRAEFTKGPYAHNDVPVVPRHTVTLAVLWSVDPTFTVSADGRYTGDKVFDNDQTNTFMKIPGYPMFDLKVAKRAGPWHFTGAVNNLLGRKAYDYGVKSLFTPGRYNAYPLPEREFTVTVSRRI